MATSDPLPSPCQSLLLGEFNNLTACYYLLAEVKIEEFKNQRAYAGKVDAMVGNMDSSSSPSGSRTDRSKFVRMSISFRQ